MHVLFVLKSGDNMEKQLESGKLFQNHSTDEIAYNLANPTYELIASATSLHSEIVSSSLHRSITISFFTITIFLPIYESWSLKYTFSNIFNISLAHFASF